MDNSKIDKGMLWTVGPQFFIYTTSLIFTAILSRIVLPADYGLINMVSTVTAFFMVFADGGLAWSVLQRKDIQTGEVKNLFWVNTIAGIFLTITCIASAPWIADFYGYKELEYLMIIMSFNFVLTGTSIVGVVWLKRNMEFKKLAIIDIVSLLASGGVGVVLALNGAGYWALAFMALLKSGIKAFAVIMLTKEAWGKYEKNIPVKPLLNFGLWVQGYAVIGYLYKNIDSVAIGKFWGSDELALYAKAMFLMNLPSMLTVGALGGYMVSLLSRYQEQPKKFHAVYLRSLRIVITISYPICLFMAFFPKETINFLYGNNWDDAIPVLRAFSGALILLPIYSTVSWLFLSKGQGRVMVVWATLSAILYLLAVYLFIDLGATGVAGAYSLVMLVLTVITLLYAHTVNKMNIFTTLKEMFNSIAIPLIAVIIIKLVSQNTLIESTYAFVMIYAMLLLLLVGILLLIRYHFNIKQAYLMSEA